MPLDPSSATTIDRRLLRRWKLPDPAVEGDKEARGRVLVIGGARQMPGAVILAATAALRVGAGKLRIATVHSVAAGVGCAMPEAYVDGVRESEDGGFHPDADLREMCARPQAVLVGPGMIENDHLAGIVLEALEGLDASQVAVLDAGALTVLHAHREWLARLACAVVITPHAGEMAKLLGMEKDAVQADPVAAVTRAARELRVVAVLKGKDTLISDGDGLWRNQAGTVGLAISGSGDTLSGLVAGLCARGAPPLHAAAWGVHLHAKAGEVLAKKVGPLGYLPRELLGEIPGLMARLGR